MAKALIILGALAPLEAAQAAAIEAAGPVASARKVATFVNTIAGDVIAARQRTVECESILRRAYSGFVDCPRVSQ